MSLRLSGRKCDEKLNASIRRKGRKYKKKEKKMERIIKCGGEGGKRIRLVKEIFSSFPYRIYAKSIAGLPSLTGWSYRIYASARPTASGNVAYVLAQGI